MELINADKATDVCDIDDRIARQAKQSILN